MKHRLLTIIALAGIVCAAVAATAVAEGKAQLFQFRGELVSASTTGVTVTVEGGNRAALDAIVGQSQNQTFTLGAKSEVLLWSNGIPTVGAVTDLKQADWVRVSIRAKAGASLADIEAKAVGILADLGTRPGKADKPLYLYAGTVDGPQAGGHIALHVRGGNDRALRSLLGQPADQTFTYNGDTIFLLWQGKVPTVIDASKLKAGDRITVRIRAAKTSTLAEIEATPAVHVGDHEPANAPDKA
jgi:hypothetical protein